MFEPFFHSQLRKQANASTSDLEPQTSVTFHPIVFGLSSRKDPWCMALESPVEKVTSSTVDVHSDARTGMLTTLCLNKTTTTRSPLTVWPCDITIWGSNIVLLCVAYRLLHHQTKNGCTPNALRGDRSLCF